MTRISRPTGTPGTTGSRRRGLWCASTALAGSLMAMIGSNAHALPTGGMVSAGTANIAGEAGKLTVNQSSQNASINWQSFNIGAGEAVQFVQPNANSVALNRVLGPDPSAILGSLSANGKVFLVNPNGVLFGQGAQVNVGGLVASTLAITDADFMAGRYKFSGASAGAILNQGTINADGGYVALLGAHVDNRGVISARLGAVALAAGNAVTLDLAGDGLLNVTVDQGAVDVLVQNGGVIRADGGRVTMTAQTAGQLLKTVVNNTGLIEAQSIGGHDGVIILAGGVQNGVVSVGGTLDASGTGAGENGGSVTVTGQNVGLFHAVINASGDAGGGTVLIGGGLHGANPAVQDAAAAYMSADSTITADAGVRGDGGEVVLWSDNSTRAYGVLSAQGGDRGGDGGMIETSGHWLDVAGIDVHAGAPAGQRGTWLLDPADVTIGAGTTNETLVGGVYTPNAGVSAATVDAGDIQTALNGGSDVTITTTNGGGVPGAGLGDITVTSALTWNTGNTLTLNADHNVIVNPGAAITASTMNSKIVLTATNDVLVGDALTASGQNSQILLTAGHDVTATGAGAITATALNAQINIGAGHNVSVVAVTADGGGAGTSVDLHADQDVLVNDAISAAGGAIVLRGDDDGTGPGVGGGTVTFAAPGHVAASATTEIRFNPNGYANTATEIANYAAFVTGTLDARAWTFPVGVDKPYDGGTVAVLQFKNPTPLDNPNVGNTVTLNGGAATFDTKDVGTLKTVNYTGYTLGGGDAARFALYSPEGVTPGDGATTADITPIPLTVTANDHAPKAYGGTVSFAGTEYTSIGLVNAEAIGGVTLTSAGALPPATVGSYAITPSNALANGAFAPANYVITYVNGTLPVTQAQLTVTADSSSKVAGTTTTLGGFTSTGLQNGETIGTVTETSPGASSGASSGGSPYVISVGNATGGTFSLANYAVTYVSGVLTVLADTTPPVTTPPDSTPTGSTPPPDSTPPTSGAGGSTPIAPLFEGATSGGQLASLEATSFLLTAPVLGGPQGGELAVLGGGVRMPAPIAETASTQDIQAIAGQGVPIPTQSVLPAPTSQPGSVYSAPVHAPKHDLN